MTACRLHELDASEAARRLARRELRAEDLVRACLDRVAERDGEVHAFVHVAADAALAHARVLDAGPLRGALHGLPLGVKDLLDTADMPTTYGSPVYAGHRPAADAAAVALCREAGSVVLGKTVTTEFAYFHPGQTRNPRNLAHTPGGSSSGSQPGSPTSCCRWRSARRRRARSSGRPPTVAWSASSLASGARRALA